MSSGVKIAIGVGIAGLVGFGVYHFVLAKPTEAAPVAVPPKVSTTPAAPSGGFDLGAVVTSFSTAIPGLVKGFQSIFGGG